MMNTGNIEILQIVEAVAREKSIPRDVIISSMEQAIQTAGKKKYGHEHDIMAEINQKTGEIKLFRTFEVVEEVEDHNTQITLEDAKHKDEEAELGKKIYEPLPPIDLGRVAAQTAKQVIVQRVKEAEKEKQFEDFKDRVGELLSGTVKRVEFGNIIVDLGRTEAIIRREDAIRSETFKMGDRIKAYIKDVVRVNKGPQIILSRTHSNIIARLLEIEVPEVYEGNIEIMAIARDPGSKAKVAVFSRDSSLDPVGSCVGVKGNRIKNVTAELGGERIDVILWKKDHVQYAINALSPAEISKVVVDEPKHNIEVIVPTEQLSIAIGRKGQNVRLAAELIGWSIDILTDEQASKKRSEEFNTSTELFMNVLDVEEIIAQLLTVEGFTEIDQIASVDVGVIASIEGFDEQLAQELQDRSVEYVNKQNEEIIGKLEALGMEQSLIDILDIDSKYILSLAEYGIKSIEDLGELSLEEFKAHVPKHNMSDDAIATLISDAAKIETSE